MLGKLMSSLFVLPFNPDYTGSIVILVDGKCVDFKGCMQQNSKSPSFCLPLEVDFSHYVIYVKIT